MRFLILRPPVTRNTFGVENNTCDPRRFKPASLDELHKLIPPQGYPAPNLTEKEAVKAVRSLYPDAVGMPFPIAIGSGQTYLLGFVADPKRPIDPDGDIPFVLFVQPVAENDHDRRTMKRDPPFDRALWKLRPIHPELGKRYEVELRATDLEVPAFASAKVGHDHRGRPTIYVEVGGIEMSLSFENKHVAINETQAAYGALGYHDR